jgi:hypothetical protein
MQTASPPSNSYKTYLFTYTFDGAKWQLPIKAKTPEEAKARLSRVLYAEYSGELVASIPVPSSWFSRLTNLLIRPFRLGH